MNADGVEGSASVAPPCPLCSEPGGAVLWQDALCRVVLVDDADYPGFCRVILGRHAAEMSDLPIDERAALMEVVFAVEAVLRAQLQPDKINLASFGNMVPHVHWHVIPRWRDDKHFPQPTWGPEQREGRARPPADAARLRDALRARLGPAG